MGRPPGKTKTFPRVVELLTAAVKEKGQKTVEAETKLSQSMISRYLKGEGEPSQATLEKLAAYFKVSVAWLRGGEEIRPNDYVGIAITAFIQALFDIIKNKKEPDPSETFESIAKAIKAEFPNMTEDEIQIQMSNIKHEALNKLISELGITIKEPAK